MNQRGWLQYFISFGLVYLLLFFSVSTRPTPVVEGICHVAVVDVSLQVIDADSVRFKVLLSYWNARPVTQRIIYDKYIDEMGYVTYSVTFDNESISLEEPPVTWTLSGPDYTTRTFPSGLTNTSQFVYAHFLNCSITNFTLPAGQHTFIPEIGYFTTGQAEGYENWNLPSDRQPITRHSYTLIANASGMFPIAEPLPEDWGSVLAVDPYNSTLMNTTDYTSSVSTTDHSFTPSTIDLSLTTRTIDLSLTAILTGVILTWGYKSWASRPR